MESAEKKWPDQYFVNVGSGSDALKLRAAQLVDMAGRYGRFDTLAYYKEDNLQFLRFEKSGNDIEYVFKNEYSDEEVKTSRLNMKQVNALHEVISDCWDSLQYERVCRGMNYHGGLYRDDKVSQGDLEEAYHEACGSLRMFGIDIGSDKNSAILENFGPYVYAVGTLFSNNPNFDAIADALKKKGVSLKDISKAYGEIKQRGLSDSWYERFVATYEVATAKRQEKTDKFLRAIATVQGCKVDEKNAMILWNALVDYNDGNMNFPPGTLMCYQRFNYRYKLFIDRLYRDKKTGELQCDVIHENGDISVHWFEIEYNPREVMENLSVVRHILLPLSVKKDSRGLLIDGKQKKAALDYVKKHGLIQTEEVPEKVKQLKNATIWHY